MIDTKDFRRKDEDTGQWVYACPEGCFAEGTDQALEFDSLYRWKAHMQKQHGGFLDSDDTATPAPVGTSDEGGGTHGEKAVVPPPKPKRLSSKSRELNEKLNECIKLCLKHMTSGLSDLDKERLTELRSEVTMGFTGIEIDFDEKLVSISGKWAALILIGLLYILPQLPTMKEVIAQARARAEKRPN